MTWEAVRPMSALVTADDAAAAEERRWRRRHAAERRFHACGVLAVAAAVAILAALLGSIVAKGHTAFRQTMIVLPISFDAEAIDPAGARNPQAIRKADFTRLARAALYERFPEAEERRDRRQLARLLSNGVDIQLRDAVLRDPSLIGTTADVELLASDDVDMLIKGKFPRDIDESLRPIDDAQLAWIDELAAEGRVVKRFNTRFFAAADSREPELAGIRGAALGSFWTILICLLVSVPVGVCASIYLEEFAPKNRWTDLIEVNINNLAAVPSIVFGLLGLAVFLNFFGMPRSAPLVGGLVLALMTLPTVIIATRAALRAVPPSIREAALGVGASDTQVVMHHVLPLALPGVLTGSIIGAAQALGETAPLLMIGMVAFIADAPAGPLDSATVLPVQIFIWSDSPERAFAERTAAAIMALLGFLICMNAAAVALRKKFERRW